MKKFVSILFTMFLIFSIHAQSADVITQILEADNVTVGQVCYLSAVEQGLMSERDTFDNAVIALVENGQIKPGLHRDDVIPAVNIAFILSQMWEIKGGLMFKLTKGSPRYAFKQFKNDGVIKPDIEPGDYISGRDFLNIYNYCLDVYGGFNVADVSIESE